jgi:ABC-type Fe3+-hydroxamate transport system substrate-binding protein
MDFIDQMNRTIRLESFPKRIVSLVPSQTELLYDLGLRDEVVGITKFCIHPDEWFRSKTRVGGTKTVHIERVKSLSPDLIIANKEENTKEDIEALMSIAPVWISDIHTVDEALDMIRSVGEIVNKKTEATELTEAISKAFSSLKQKVKSKKVLYLIWENPIMGVGGDTFIHDVLQRLGLENVLADENRYPEMTDEDIPILAPEIIILSSEPYPYKEEHVKRYLSLQSNSKVLLLDGEFFSWYGSRMLHAPRYFESCFESIKWE